MRCLITKNSSRYALCNNSKKFYSKIVTLKSRKTNFPSCLPRLSGPLHDYSFAGSHTLHFLSFHLFQVFKNPFSSNIFFRVSLDMERVYDESCSMFRCFKPGPFFYNVLCRAGQNGTFINLYDLPGKARENVGFPTSRMIFR